MARAVATLMDGGVVTLLNLQRHNIWAAELASGYAVSDWIWDTERDPRALLLELVSKMPSREEADATLRGRFHASEFALSRVEGGSTYQYVEAPGPRAAVVFSDIGLSICSEDRWVQIPFRHRWLDDDCEWQMKRIKALNLSESSQVERLLDLWLEQIRQDLWADPGTLPARKHDYFPHLAFGLDVTKYLKDFPRSHLQSAATKLLVLDSVSRDCRRDPTMVNPVLPLSHAESEPTKQQYGSQRVFRGPDGARVTYEFHAVAGRACRIYYRVTHEPRGIEIGYMGRHLDTVRHH